MNKRFDNILKRLPQGSREEVGLKIEGLYRRHFIKLAQSPPLADAENSQEHDHYERTIERPEMMRKKVKKVIRNAATWLVCAKCTAKILADWWWF